MVKKEYLVYLLILIIFLTSNFIKSENLISKFNRVKLSFLNAEDNFADVKIGGVC